MQRDAVEMPARPQPAAVVAHPDLLHLAEPVCADFERIALVALEFVDVHACTVVRG